MNIHLVPRPPGLGYDLDVVNDVYRNDTNFTTVVPTVATTTSQTPVQQPVCQWIRYEDIAKSRVRIWDVIILIPNVLFLMFLLIKFRVFTVALISVLRCIVSMTVNAAMPVGDYADRVLWLVLRFFLLATELSVVIFGLAFDCFTNTGHLDSRTSIQRVLLITFSSALIYSCTQGVLEFIYPNDKFHVKHDGREYNIFGHGGMLFWFISSVLFFVFYVVICLLPFTKCRERFALPTKRSFYVYALLLAILNALQATGSELLYVEIGYGMCIVDVTSYLYFTCYAPLVYGAFLWEFFKTSHPPDILFSYKAQLDDEEEDSVHLPHTSNHGVRKSDVDPMTSSYDSTHFDTNSPNPLYTSEFHFSPELSINTDYFTDNNEVHDEQSREVIA
ncbi:hypothetical protein LSH36_328g01050 [Paralvinella palmiformis]|uniref:Transmembrane protein adipocyte-associated 1 homolog n=1 Tax=Paralvinella palmiformis TaxID=53620 RepID=A0AAD9JFY0_9ANNE|nr:hypothetical protein LSH36_328g01050 [Paralvinella palmiformis]